MEKFLEAAAIAWNPIGQVRRRMGRGTLTVGSVLVPFIGIVIACNLLGAGAQRFFFESLFHAIGRELGDHPLMGSYAQRMMATLGVLVPVGAVSLLPAGVFRPAGRSATGAALMIVAAAWAFYGAAVTVPLYFFGGALALVNPELALLALTILTIPIGIGVIGLVLFFWFRITLSVLGLGGAQVIGISVLAAFAEALLAGFVAYVSFASV